MNIYFSGIGGVGIGPLAEIALDVGYGVCGSDIAESLITSELRARGIAVSIGQDGEFLQACHDNQPVDWLIHTSSLPDNHPELVLAKKLGIKTAKRDELIAHIIAEKNLKLIAVAGTHGKTTTTGMMVWAMQQLNIPISYSVGTTLGFGPSGKYTSESQYFVYECDEFDRNFLNFYPNAAIITSVSYDHPDTYPKKSDYMQAFSQFISQSDIAIMWQHDIYTIASSKPPKNTWALKDTEVAPVQLAGAHNRRNATLVLKTLEYLKLAPNNTALDILNNFPGTNRRFEKLADNIYSDYGHHPAEIAATLQMARELSDHIVLVYQPHQNIRQHEIRDQYTDCFSLAEDVYWLPTYLSREDPNLTILTPTELSQNVANKKDVHIADLDEKLWNDIKSAQASGKLVLAMGAGSIDGWLRNRLSD